MTRVELPHVNVLSKIDTIRQYGALDFDLSFYTDLVDIRQLLDKLPAPGKGDGGIPEDQMTPVQK